MPPSDPTPTVDPAAIAAFERDGVVCLRGVIERPWIERLRGAAERAILDPAYRGHRYGKPHHKGVFFGAFYMWQRDADFRAFAFDSPAPAIIAAMLRSREINLYHDHLLIKEPGSEAPTPWHHDIGYMCMRGARIASVWVPLDDVTVDNGRVAYVRGSHRWGRMFQPADWADYHAQGRGLNPELEPIPDIEANRADYDIVAWDVAPGDCIVSHAVTLHGASGNATTGRRRRALAVRYAGDDARYESRLGTIKPHTTKVLLDGDPLDPECFPLVWPRGA